MTQYVVNSGQTRSGLILGSSDTLVVNGGTIVGTVNSGGSDRLNGGTGTGTQILAGGLEGVYFGGVARGTVIDKGRQEIYQAGATGTVIRSGGLQSLFIGSAENDVVNKGGVVSSVYGDLPGLEIKGGYVDLLANSTAESAVVGGGGILEVDGGTTSGTFQYKFTTFDTAAVATGTLVQSGGLLRVAGGVTSNSLIQAGGLEQVLVSGSDPASDTGTSDGTSVLSGGEEDVSSGAVAKNTLVHPGGILSIDGSSIGSLVGGSETVFGTATGDTVQGGGLQLLYGIASGTILDQGVQTDLGQAFDTVVNSGGSQTVFGTATHTIVNAGGVQNVNRADGDFGVASGTLLHSGAGQVVLGGSTVQTVIETGATESVSDGSVGGTRIEGGTLILEDGGVATGGIRFAGSGGSLQVQGLSLPGTTIFGFGSTDSIDLEGYGYVAGGSASLGNTNVLSITGLTGGAATLALDPAASYAGKRFTLAPDGKGGTLVTVRDVPKLAAVADSYSMLENTRLSVNVRNGVLINDAGSDMHVLSAALVGGPLHGEVTLNRNGSFDYTPTKGFLGRDSFTYRATDGTAVSSPATVSLNVKAPAMAAVAADPLGLMAAFTANSGVTLSPIASASLPEANIGSGNAASLLAAAATVDPVPVLSHHVVP